ncbi:class I SAM-dependent methyltransferase [Patescibacteria group bacterium]|nr:class I SAM-dependent methyltransferase [Patescibacteria group bacterium]
MDQKTIQTYNQMAKEYDDETIDFWERFPRTFFDKFAKLVHGKVLDVGSGPGRDGLLLKEKGLEVICLDASEAMVKLCEEKGLQSIIGDFTSMPCDDNSFDGAWAYTSLLHIPKVDVSKAFNEIRRILKDRGILSLGLIEGDTEEYRESSGVNMPRWFSFYKKEEIEQLLAQHGFEILYFEQFQPRSKNYLNFIARKQ